MKESASIKRRAADAVFYVCANRETEDNDGSETTLTGVGRNSEGVINQGFIFGESLVGTIIKIDQGLDTSEISPKRKLDDELKETSYTIQIDNRLGKIVDTGWNASDP